MTDPRSSTVDGVLHRTARRSPHRTALRFADRTWSYAELDDAVSRAAGALLATGLRAGDRVATYGRNSDAYLLAYLGCARAGLVHVPINHALTGEELAYLLTDSGATLGLVDPPLAAALDAVLPGTGITASVPLRDAPGFYNCFGQSEIGPLATVLQPEEHRERPESCGRPVLFVDVRVVTDDGADAGPDEAGELWYRSPQLCVGYWNKAEQTTEAFTDDGWFRSGDLVRRDAEGYLFVVDRIKDVINTGGVMVASREVEDALYTHPGVAEVAVVATPDDRWIEAVTAVVVRRDSAEGAAVDEATLVAHARTTLAGFKVPKRVHFVAELPRNQSGKLLTRVLRDDLTGQP